MPLFRVFLKFPKPPGQRKTRVRVYLTAAPTAKAAVRKACEHHAGIYPEANPVNKPLPEIATYEVVSGVYLVSTYLE